jgi:hypothetical protein
MAVFTRRNAALGWVALLVGKRVLRRKAKAVAAAVGSEGKRPTRKALALLAAAGVGAAAFLRRQAGGENSEL